MRGDHYRPGKDIRAQRGGTGTDGAMGARVEWEGWGIWKQEIQFTVLGQYFER
jgi:hypothetical protein